MVVACKSLISSLVCAASFSCFGNATYSKITHTEKEYGNIENVFIENSNYFNQLTDFIQKHIINRDYCDVANF